MRFPLQPNVCRGIFHIVVVIAGKSGKAASA